MGLGHLLTYYLKAPKHNLRASMMFKPRILNFPSKCGVFSFCLSLILFGVIHGIFLYPILLHILPILNVLLYTV